MVIWAAAWSASARVSARSASPKACVWPAYAASTPNGPSGPTSGAAIIERMPSWPAKASAEGVWANRSSCS